MENTTNDFKIIIKAKKIPVNINNEIIEYTQDNTRPNNHLYCEIFFQKTLIAKGIILDFYKEFEVLKFNGNLFTQIKTFEYHGNEYQSHTKFGNMIYKMKYLTKPPIEEKTRKLYINEFISIFNGYINSLKETHKNLNITYIPSESEVPNNIANMLCLINEIPLKTIICKNNNLIQSKELKSLSRQTFDKYIMKLNTFNIDDIFILIDDVMGTGASLCETMYKLYNFNKKVNFFFIPVKDVRR